MSAANLLPVPPPVRKTPHPGKPPAFLLILRPVKNRQVDHLAVQGQGKAGDLPGVQAQVGAQADRGPGFEAGRPGRLDQVGDARFGNLDLLVRLQEVDGVQGIALDQLLEDLGERIRLAEAVQPDHLAVDQEDRPHLALDGPEMTGVFFHVPGLPLIDGGHGHAGRTGLHSVGLLGDLIPDGPLVGPEFPGLAQGVLDLLGLLGPDAVGQDPLPAGKPGAVVGPAALLHAAHRDDQGGMGGHQDGGVHDPVLLGPHQLLPVQDQDHPGGLVDHLQVRDMPALADLGHLHQAVIQGLVERQVIQGNGLSGEQGKQGQVLIDLLPTDFDLIQVLV